MEVCYPVKSSAGQDVRNNIGFLTDPVNPTCCNYLDLSVNKLQTCLTRYLNIGGFEISTGGCNLSPEKNVTLNIVREDEHKDVDKSKPINSVSDKCFSECVVSPLDESRFSDGGLLGKEKLQEGKTDDVSDANDCAKSVDECCLKSISIHGPIKLVSAMKGSREKNGKEPRKLSVTWAPDVYDPIPTSVSHIPSSKNQRYNKKYGKHTRSKSKDKKQTRKKSSSKYKPLYDYTGVVGLSGYQGTTLTHFNVMNPKHDVFPGSST